MSQVRSTLDVPVACVATGIGVAMAAVGLALALDFRGMTTRHVGMTSRMMGPVEGVLRRVPPWKQLLRKPPGYRERAQVRRERIAGAVFAVVGLGLSLLGIVRLVGWLLF